MKRGGPLRRTTPLRTLSALGRGKALKRTAWTPKRKDDPVTAAIRADVARRSGGRCEARATRLCTGFGEHIHHRKLRRHGDHSPANLLHVCLMCHTAIHATPAVAYEHGWMVRAADDPASIPVRALAPE